MPKKKLLKTALKYKWSIIEKSLFLLVEEIYCYIYKLWFLIYLDDGFKV